MAKVVSVTPIGFSDVYNMEVKDVHNFSINGGLVVHNCDALRYWCSAWRSAPQGAVDLPRYAFKSEMPELTTDGYDVPDAFLLGGY